MSKKKSDSFADKAEKIIDSGMELLQKRLDRTLQMENELDELLGILAESGDLTAAELKSIVKKLDECKIHSIREITSSIGTLYDKRALALGDSTANTAVQIKLPDGVDEYAG